MPFYRIPARRLLRWLLRRMFAVVLAVGCFILSVEYFILLAPSKQRFPVDISSQINWLNSENRSYKSKTSIQLVPSMLPSKQNTTQAMNAKLHFHVWSDLCGTNIETLRKSPLFPDFPDKRSFVQDFKFRSSEIDGINTGFRMFGLIEPPKSGRFKFEVHAAVLSSELWLSSNEDPHLSRLIVNISSWTVKQDNKNSTRVSEAISLRAGKKYFIEALGKQDKQNAVLTVCWFSLNTSSEIISSQHLSGFAETKEIPNHAGKRAKSLETELDRYSFYRLPFVGKEEYIDSIPSCLYHPSFVVKRRLSRYEGALKLLAFNNSKVFPGDETDMQNRSRGWTEPNLVADKGLIHSVVNKLVSSLKSRKYFVKRIHKVIQKSDSLHGERFSVDLELGLTNTSFSFRLSEHVYQKTGTDSLCFPEGIKWNSNATVYFILPVKNQGKWVHHFIEQLSEASLVTGDTNFHVVVVDFESQDIDMVKAFNTSLLSGRHTVVTKKGKFYKSAALNEAVNFVPSPHDIVFLFDLHIDVPADIMDSVRKNTVEGKIAYLPVVGRLDCDSNSDEHRGFWQMNGYGLAAVYKSDWIRFGGMNVVDFKYEWGGEDWDLLNRVLSAQLEVERVKQPGLFHHHHSKQRRWN